MLSNSILRRSLPFLRGYKNSYQLSRNLTSRSGNPLNTIVVFVPQQEAWIVQRFGKYSRTLEPGLNLLVPIVEKVAYVQSLKELSFNIPDQPAVTMDNVVLQINGVLFLKVRDPYMASYGIEDGEFAVTQLAQTTMRSELGKITLDQVFKERETLNANIVASMNKATEPWGVECLRYEIRDIHLPEKIQIAMQMQVEADRKKRAAILESEGLREAAINKAEGLKKSTVLESEARQIHQINMATGQAEAIQRVADAKAAAIRTIAEAISKELGHNAVQFSVAEQYIEAFSKLAKESNTVLLPSQTGDVASMVTQAMSIYKTINTNQLVDPSLKSNSSETTNFSSHLTSDKNSLNVPRPTMKDLESSSSNTIPTSTDRK